MSSIVQKINSRTGFYKYIVWGNVAALMLFLIGMLLASPDGNEANLAFTPLIVPAVILLPIDLILIPIYLIKRLVKRDRSDIFVQIASVILYILLVVWIVWSVQTQK